MDIILKNGKWLVNGKEFKNLTMDERRILGIFIESYKNFGNTQTLI